MTANIGQMLIENSCPHSANLTIIVLTLLVYIPEEKRLRLTQILKRSHKRRFCAQPKSTAKGMSPDPISVPLSSASQT